MYFLSLSRKIIKYAFVVFGVIGSIILALLITMYLSCSFLLKSRQIQKIKNDNFEVSVWREPGLMDNSPVCRVYVRKKGEINWMLLSTNEDTLSVDFVNEDAIKVLFYNIYWHNTYVNGLYRFDSLYFNLNDNTHDLFVGAGHKSISKYIHNKYSKENLYLQK